jgi:hypothetical protein
VANVTIANREPWNHRRRITVENRRAHDDREDAAVNESKTTVRDGDVIEFSLRGERRTAEVMLVTDDGMALLDLFDGDRPAFARLEALEDVAVYSADASELATAA